MFLTLAEAYTRAGLTDPQNVQTLPAEQLNRWLEEFWYHRTLDDRHRRWAGFDIDFANDLDRIRVALGHPQADLEADHGMSPSGLLAGTVARPEQSSGDRFAPFRLRPDYDGTGSGTHPLLPPCRVWHHLIYAYLIEATGAYDVLAEVARRLVMGESLGVLRRDSIVWARNTEELFFRNPPLFGVAGVVSDLRPSRSVNRRNAYWRMFGMDLPHLIPPGWPGSGHPEDWKTGAGSAVNTDFQDKLVELLRQVWKALINVGNTSGPNQADPGYITLLCQALGDMLRARRQNGLLAREEFAYVATMSWFHLTLLRNGPIVADMQAESTAPEQRLASLAQKVGMRSSPRARELFQVAERLSILLRAIELRAFDTEAQARLLYEDPQLGQDMRQIVNLWQSATGQRIKDQDAVPSATTPSQPLRIPTPGAPVGAGTNGSGTAGGG